MAKNQIKSFMFPKAKSPNLTPKPVPVAPEQQILKQFAVKPVVKPAKVSNKALTKPLKSYLP